MNLVWVLILVTSSTSQTSQVAPISKYPSLTECNIAGKEVLKGLDDYDINKQEYTEQMPQDNVTYAHYFCTKGYN